MRKSQDFFICQQGFAVPNANPHLYSALMLQPRIIGGVVALGVFLQSPTLFLALSAVLAWGTLIPTQNVFDAIYNDVVAYRRGYPPLGVAPGPRRFAQGMASTFALVIGVALLSGATTTAWILEGLFAGANASVVFGRFCAPANLYHVMRRRLSPPSSLPAGASQGC
jgi:Domain of unknown function (DUF4395)